MDATPFDFDDARLLCGLGTPMRIDSPRHDAPDGLAGKWSAIHDAAATVAAIAGIDSHLVATELEQGRRSFPADTRGSDILDFAEIMERGISALLVAHTSGGAPKAAARALWKDFLGTRESLMAIEPDAGGGNSEL